MKNQRRSPSKSPLPRLLLLLLVIAAVGAVLHGFKARSRTSSPPIATGPLSITFFDVGPGESSLIQTPLGKNILVDTGPPSARATLFADLQRCGVHELDVLLITHPSSDCTGNIQALLRQIPVAGVMDGTIDTVRAASLLRPPTVPATPSPDSQGPRLVGQTVDLGGDSSLEYMTVTDGKSKRPKDGQLILWVNMGRVCTMLLGGANPQERASLLARLPNVHATVLQTAPSTLNDGPDLGFLGRVQPDAMVISRRLGPHAPPRSAAEKFALHPLQSRTWRTDEHGSLTLQTNGEAYRIISVDQASGIHALQDRP